MNNRTFLLDVINDLSYRPGDRAVRVLSALIPVLDEQGNDLEALLMGDLVRQLRQLRHEHLNPARGSVNPAPMLPLDFGG